MLPPTLRLTPEQFALVCGAIPESVPELAADGLLIRMTPTGGNSGVRNINLTDQLSQWARSQANGVQLGWLLLPEQRVVEAPAAWLAPRP